MDTVSEEMATAAYMDMSVSSGIYAGIGTSKETLV